MSTYAIEGCQIIERLLIHGHDFRQDHPMLELWRCDLCGARMLIHADRSPILQAEYIAQFLPRCEAS